MVTVAIAIGLALLIQAFLVKPYRIPSGSMIPTLTIGQRILVNRLDTHPGLGDIVVFHPPAGADPTTAVCGNPSQGAGHTQAATRAPRRSQIRRSSSASSACPATACMIRNGHVCRNGVKETGSYIQQCDKSPAPTAHFPKTIMVPAGEYYMMGDNRGDSDSTAVLGPGAAEMDHRGRVRHLLADRPHRLLLGRGSWQRRALACWRALASTVAAG